MTGNLGSGAHSLNGLFVKFCRCIQTLHNLHWIYYYLTKYCFQSVVSRVVIGGGGGCRSWIEGVALIEPRWHLHTPQCRLQSGTNSSTPPLQLHQSVVGIDPGGRGCSRSKCICEEDLGRMDEEKRKWGRGGRSRKEEKEDWWRSWRSPPAMTFSDSTPSRCYSHLTIIRGRIWSPAIKLFWLCRTFGAQNSQTSITNISSSFTPS